MANKLFLIIIIFLIKQIITNETIKNNCGSYINIEPKVIKEIPNNKRVLQNINDTEINIFLDLNYIEEGIITNNLLGYRSIIIDSFNKVAQTLESLIKVTSKHC